MNETRISTLWDRISVPLITHAYEHMACAVANASPVACAHRVNRLLPSLKGSYGSFSRVGRSKRSFPCSSLARHLGWSGWDRLEENFSSNEKTKYRRALLSPQTRFVGGKKQEKERKKFALNRERTRDPIDGRHLGCCCWGSFLVELDGGTKGTPLTQDKVRRRKETGKKEKKSCLRRGSNSDPLARKTETLPVEPRGRTH